MAINFGTQLFTSPSALQPGQLIEFGYGGSARWGIVVAAAWKMNCDCYVFDSKEDVSEELLEWVGGQQSLVSGDIYNAFGNQHTFKSFKLEKMDAIQNIEFNTYSEDEEVEVTGEGESVEEEGSIWELFGITDTEG